ncbi:MAG: PDDEXK nuclease domain-containing protein [Megasphaera sp.]|jgi:predicted nuclease of restriction endonuclease-like (RecB) superfamily|nr:PDDEXK nuclease domain-containing protein [Megasphaera sp.]MCI1248597.1 PDDEXK nuclease domain-containing protein [Megasphaera sp.]
MEKTKKRSGTDLLTWKIENLIEDARKQIVTQVNSAMVQTYYEIGYVIVEYEQNGEPRASYGKGVLKELSKKLNARFGRGFSVDNLENMRRFYLIYSQVISETSSRKSEHQQLAENISPKGVNFSLSWSHYLFLMHIDNRDERKFYETEAIQEHWSLRELKRQFNSALFERIMVSKDKKAIVEMSKQGIIIEKPEDIVKDPYILEFLGLSEESQYSESTLEQKIIDKLQTFLLELGKGYTFVGRQVRLTFDEKHFYVDLVFFNRLLQCFVLIDLKIGEITHQNLGQMQMYVHYYDRQVKLPTENPTIGIVLCKKKDNTLVELTLPEDNTQIFASKYQTVLPNKDEFARLLEGKTEEEENGND